MKGMMNGDLGGGRHDSRHGVIQFSVLVGTVESMGAVVRREGHREMSTLPLIPTREGGVGPSEAGSCPFVTRDVVWRVCDGRVAPAESRKAAGLI